MESNREWTFTNTELEKKFKQYNTTKNDKHNIRQIFWLADDIRKLELLQNIDTILLEFNKIHTDVLIKQIQIINEWTKDILAQLSQFEEKTQNEDVLANLN